MQVTDKIRRLKQFVEATIEQTKAQELTGQAVGVEFSIASAKGEVSATEAVAFMQAILQALSKFDEDMVTQFGFNLQIVHPAQDAISEAVQAKMKAIVELEANGEAAKKKLVVG